MALPQMSVGEQAKLQMMQDLEIEMMSDLYNRMTSACHKKCIPPKYNDSELGELHLITGLFYFYSTYPFCREGRVRLHRSLCRKISGCSREDRQEAHGHVVER